MKFKALRVWVHLKELLNLKKHDFDEEGCAIAIRENIEFRSGNAWSLIFAIFVASIGLQVNSTAVIIGAMLISPLMGPIIGAGFALATNDIALVRKSVSNLGYAVSISIVASTTFFLISPEASAQSELLARTQPTFFDVLIAFFGGAAGIVASSRKSKGNALPGVAIATALMPPLCTVGYGIANFEMSFILGALYLFTINALFIFLSTYLFAYFLEFKMVTDRNDYTQFFSQRIHRWLSISVVIVVIPSLFMAWYLQKKLTFNQKANHFIEKEVAQTGALVGQKNIRFGLRDSEIQVSTFGKSLDEKTVESLRQSLADHYNLDDVKLVINTIDNDRLDLVDIEEKFATKVDIFKMKEEEAELQKQQQLERLELAQTKIQSKFPEMVESITLNEGSIYVNWKKSVAKVKKSEAEKLIAESLIVPPIVHFVEGKIND